MIPITPLFHPNGEPYREKLYGKPLVVCWSLEFSDEPRALLEMSADTKARCDEEELLWEQRRKESNRHRSLEERLKA